MTAVIGLTTCLIGGSDVAWAGPAADAHTDNEGIDTEALNDGASAEPHLPGTEKKPDQAPLRCEYTPVDPETATIADRLAEKGWANPKGEGEGAWYRRTCWLQNGDGEFSDVVWVPARRVDPAALAEEARDRLPLPAPAIGMNPPADVPDRPHVVNGPATWLYLDGSAWRSYSSTVAVPGVSVTATAEPVRVRWEMGTGDTVECGGPGMPYAEGATTDCSYVWPRASRDQPGGRFTVRVTVEWRASWSVTGAAGGGALPSITRTATVDVEVREKQAVNTKP